MYRIFNVAIDSALALPELPELDCPSDMKVYGFTLASKADLTASLADVNWFHDWVDPRGNVTIRAGRSEDRHWLRFPRLADFSIDLAGRQITAFPVPNTDHSTIRHLLLDQVIPRVLGQEGALVLHAGAVQLQNGKTLAFVGQTGWGKSTLVSSFEQNGALLLSDDCVMVVQHHGMAYVIPNYAGVRLFDDSINAIYGRRQRVAEVARYTTKRRLLMADEGQKLECDPRRLDGIFLLGDPAEVKNDWVDIQLTAGTEALMMLVAQCFVLDISDKVLVSKQFKAAGVLLRSQQHCYRLEYPHNHDRLAEVRTAVEQAVL